MSEASKGESETRVAEDLCDLGFKLSETVGDHSDRIIGLAEARRCGDASDNQKKDDDYRRQRDYLASHVCSEKRWGVGVAMALFVQHKKRIVKYI